MHCLQLTIISIFLCILTVKIRAFQKILKISSFRNMKSSSRNFASIEQLNFDNRNINSLPIDKSKEIISRQVPNSIFSLVEPTSVKNPSLVVKSTPALELLGLSQETENEIIEQYFSGNKVIPGSRPAAHCYCGHQFGSFAGQLGDGATMYLGECINPNTGERWELQLKGAGKTPYSRSADGRKVLRSSVREFLCSEAMFYLDVPTTRAGTCITSSSTVERDPFYDGNVIDEKCTIISRIAPNFFRFGSFEIFKKAENEGERGGPSAGNEGLKEKLLNHIVSYYPDLSQELTNGNTLKAYTGLFEEVMKRTIKLVVSWQKTGFVHGVLNTDNMSVMGLTIDYGPFGFMEFFDPDFVPNGSDNSARYSYKEQPMICKWNLIKFAEALMPLLPREESEKIIEKYDNLYKIEYYKEMNKKFGFLQEVSEESEALINEFFKVMGETWSDFTDVFVALTEFHENLSLGNDLTMEKSVLFDKILSRTATPENIIAAHKRKMKIHRVRMHPQEIMYLWQVLEENPEKVKEFFVGAPVEAIRNEIEMEKKKLDLLINSNQEIQRYEMMKKETKLKYDTEKWNSWLEKYYTFIEKENSVSTEDNISLQRTVVMRKVNPTFVLRNWLAQDAISLAEGKKSNVGGEEQRKEDFNGVQTLYEMLKTPFNPEFSTFKKESESTKKAGSESEKLFSQYISTPPEGAESLICTCSS